MAEGTCFAEQDLVKRDAAESCVLKELHLQILVARSHRCYRGESIREVLGFLGLWEARGYEALHPKGKT